jgi:hypothetical protein
MIDSTVAAGTPCPVEIDRIREGLAALRDPAAQDHAYAALLDAVMAGNRAEVGVALDRLALARTGARGRVYEEMKPEAVSAILRAWRAASPKAHAVIGDLFNEAAAELTEASQTIDLEAKGEDILERTKKDIDAWKRAPSIAARLDELGQALIDSAVLAGIRDVDDMAELALCVDMGKAHRRRVVECWHDREPHRAGRWGQLLLLGCALRAPASLDDFAPYPPLAAVVRLGAERVDPEDGPEAAAKAAEITKRQSRDREIAQAVTRQYR